MNMPAPRRTQARADGRPPVVTAGPAGTFAFSHPGILHSRSDLDRIRDAVAQRQSPVHDGYQALAAHPRSSYDYSVQNTGDITTWGRGPANHMSEAVGDAAAAYQNALMWYVSGDARHAEKARSILAAWTSSLTAITGADGELGAGLQAFKLVNAAEILRHAGFEGWTAEDTARCERSFTDVWYPALSGYALFANGNWDVIAMQTIAAIGVFCGSRVMFEDALRFAAGGSGNGSVLHRIVTADGQGQESGRDQTHEQLAIGALADLAQLAWNQGVDLFGFADRRILANTEYAARYNLGYDVPFTPHLDRTGKYLRQTVSAVERGKLTPVYEMVHGHYAGRLGLPMPYTEQLLFRGDGGARMVEGSDEDLPGWGTLTFARPAEKPTTAVAPPGAPAGLTSYGSAEAVTISWIPSVEPSSAESAADYTVRRAVHPDGPYLTVAEGVTGTAHTDRSAQAGRTYHYIVSARNKTAQSAPSMPVSVMAGLPGSWQTHDVGDVRRTGTAGFDGERFTLEAGGADIGGTADAFRFVHLPVRGDAVITARLVFPLSSQYSKVGVMVRGGLEADAPHAAMFIQGLPLAVWSGVWTVRAKAGGTTGTSGSTPVPPGQESAAAGAEFPASDPGTLPHSATPLAAPYVEAASDGYRMRMPYWVRLERKGSLFTGSVSPDGATWTAVGSTELSLDGELRMGLAACSCLGIAQDLAETGTATFDNVELAVPGEPGWQVPPPVAAPVGLHAQAGRSAIELSWDGPDLSARYTVKRATRAKGPYQKIATGIGPVGFGVRSRYPDADARPGTTYHYLVTKTNVAGEGPSSARASATMPTPPRPAVSEPAIVYANSGRPFAHGVRGTHDPIRFFADDLPEGLHMDEGTGLITGTPLATGDFRIGIGTVNAGGTGTSSLTIAVRCAPPPPWTYGDLGDHVLDERLLGIRGMAAVHTPGITAYDPTTRGFRVRGSGADLNVNAQGMTGHFARLPVTGDCTITARVAGRSSAGGMEQIGLGMTRSLSPFDRMAAVVLAGDGDGATGTEQFLVRKAGGATTSTGADGIVGAAWLRLQRSGAVFTASISCDGAAWTTLGQETVLDFGQAPYYVGLLVCSRDPAALATADFDHVTITPDRAVIVPRT